MVRLAILLILTVNLIAVNCKSASWCGMMSNCGWCNGRMSDLCGSFCGDCNKPEEPAPTPATPETPDSSEADTPAPDVPAPAVAPTEAPVPDVTPTEAPVTTAPPTPPPTTVPEKLTDEEKNKKYKECCKKLGLPTGCQDLCSFDVTTDELQSAVIVTGACPLDKVSKITKCGGAGKDNTECCRDKGVLNASPHCADLCKADDFVLGANHFACASQFSHVLSCGKAAYDE